VFTELLPGNALIKCVTISLTHLRNKFFGDISGILSGNGIGLLLPIPQAGKWTSIAMSITLPKYEGALSLLVLLLCFMHIKNRCGYQNCIKLGHKIKPPFNISQFDVFHHLKFNLNETKLIVSALNYLHSRNSSI
jgi:hypothetical protein